jgi:uncharacterized membrane protein YebE (DUF533 family)
MDIDKMISGLISSGVLGGLAGGAASVANMGNRNARKTAGTLLMAGGIAALGAVAWKAYQAYLSRLEKQCPGPAAQPPADPGWGQLSQEQFQLDDSSPQSRSTALLLVEAMISAASADGHMDGEERKVIVHRVGQLDLAADEKAMVFDALHKPLSLTGLCQQVDSPEVAIKVYLSSLMAIDRTRAESGYYLDALAFRLGLPEDLTAQLVAGMDQDTLRQVA